MTFSYQKKALLNNYKERKLATFLWGLFLATAMFLPFIIFSKGYFIFYGDFNVQQIPFYQLCHDAVRNGNFGWNWNTDLGSDFIGSYSFYCLGSPFFWLTIPFKNSFVPYLMGPLLILKFACASLTSYLYIRRFTRTPFAAQIGALIYAFSGFSVYNIFFNHFHEAIIFFPLLLLALELLITENKRGLFALAVMLCAVVNYFFFFTMVVFTIIYWFIRTVSKGLPFRFSRFLILIFEAVLGVALAAFLLLPSLAMIVSNGRVSEFLTGWSAILYGKEQIYLNVIECFFFPPDIPARPVFFPDANVKWSSLGGWLPLFGMTGVIGFCISKKGHWLKRIIFTSAFMAFVPILNSAFYAFNDSYYARWFYMPILMMALATSITIEDKDINWKSGFIWSSVITVAISLVVALFPQIKDGHLIFGLYTDAGNKNNIYFPRLLIAIGIALISLVFTLILILLKNKKAQKIFRMATIGFLSLVIVSYGCVYLYQGSYHSHNRQSVMIDKLIEGKVNLEDGNYRIDTYSCVDNTGMYLSYPTINAFHSVVSPSIMEYYEFIGVNRDVASRPPIKYNSVRNLLSVKYLLNREDGESFVDQSSNTLMPYYNYLKTEGGYYIYENECYIPYGFSYDYYMTEDECEHLYSDVSRADAMLKAIILSKEDAQKYGHLLSRLTDYKESEDIVIDFEESTEETEQESEETQTVPATYSDQYVLSLSLSDEKLREDSLHLAESSAVSFETDKKGFSATVVREKANLVFFSVPYSEGFTATVNGEKAEIIKANIGFMAVEVPAGVSDIRFDYTTPMLKEGIYISAGSLIVFILYIILCAIFLRKKGKQEYYPEGDMLLAHWGEEICQSEEEDCNENALDFLDVTITDSVNKKDESIYNTGFNIDLSEFLKEKDIDNKNEE